METKIYDFEKLPFSLRHGRYGGQAGDKDGVLIDGENYIIKFPKSTKDFKGDNLSAYTTAPLSEYIGSHIYEILGIPVHKTMLGIRNGKLVVACKDFSEHFGDLLEIRTIKNAANKELSVYLDKDLPSSATGDSVNLDELFLHFEKNPILKRTKGLAQRFWDMVIIDILIDNNDRNNGNWGVLINEQDNSYTLAPVYDNGNSFTNKVNDVQIEKYLSETNNDRIIGTRTAYSKDGHILSSKKMLSLENEDLYRALKALAPVISEKMDEIQSFIRDIPNEVCSDARKDYYIKSLDVRFNDLIMPAYEKVMHMKSEQHSISCDIQDESQILKQDEDMER